MSRSAVSRPSCSGSPSKLSQAGQTIRFGKPLATSLDWDPNKGPLPQPLIDDDVRFVGDTLGLSADNLLPSLHLLSHTTATQRLGQGDVTAGAALDLRCETRSTLMTP